MPLVRQKLTGVLWGGETISKHGVLNAILWLRGVILGFPAYR